MSYFRNVRYVPYFFGNSAFPVLHQDLGSYIDLIDQVKTNSSFYQKYTILDGERPDTLSFKLYDSVKYYWTFFLLNDDLREQGWPLREQDILALVKEERPNTTLTTRDDLTEKFLVGSTVTGRSSGTMGTVIRRRLDFGQIVIEGDKNFLSDEDVEVTEDGTTHIVTLVGAVEQYNSVHHYEDADGVRVDINPYNGPGQDDLPVTYYEHYRDKNDSLKDIIVIKPDAIDAIYERYQESVLAGS